MRRLSIVDLATGQQPMTMKTERLVIFNGEIYNHRPIRDTLQQQATSSHTKRHRSHHPRLRSIRRSVRRAVQRHVRLRHLGRLTAQTVSGTRSTGHQTTLLLER